MSRGRWIFEDGKLIPYESRKSNSPHHFVIDDTMPDMWHPCTGQMINSKSKFRQITKQHGCIEYGNEKLKDKRDLDVPGTKEALIKAYNEYERKR